ncbi:hypothetical protein GCM10010401_11350 [Rarobacter faecitabidus]|uniref:PD-(D/E)XK nuclease superfamily protein n=1 Tax=Rarobacter faecitabidus TaxID=13243 RepID=A0A542ZP23_RARFA|nr:PD-(D/E)XK nuclease family protein [Rarobacter faecitabidus]TQL62124.1 PD-(D/E)XK nuclease superfamily protein [Rarobacter faecitabidus]
MGDVARETGARSVEDDREIAPGSVRTDVELVAARVHQLRAVDPLGRITVIVDSPAAGRHLLRVLAANAPIFNVEPITLGTLVERFSSVSVAQDQEILLAAAHTCGAIEDFGDVRREVSTVAAVARVFRELSRIPVDEWPATQSGVSSIVLTACREMAGSLSGALAHDWIGDASVRLQGDSAHASLGSIVAHEATLRHGTRAGFGPVIAALNSRTEVVALAESTQRIHTVIEAAHPLAEALAVIQRVLAAGPGSGGIGIALSDPSIYAREVAHLLDAAGIPWHGLTGRTLLETRTARTALAMIAVTPDLRRDQISAVVEPGLITVNGFRLRFAAFENLTRRTGFDDGGVATRRSAAVAGGDDWTRLNLIEDGAADEEQWRVEQRDATAELVGTCARLATAASGNYRQLGAQLLAALALVARDSDPAEAGARTVIDTLARQWRDHGMPLPSSARGAAELLSRSLNVGVNANSAPRSRVVVGTVAQMRSLDLDHLFVLGAGEGSCPTVPAEDPLLPDAERQQVTGLSTVSDRIAEQGEDWRTALRAARAVTVSYARDSLRSNVEQFASRYLDRVPAAKPDRVVRVGGIAQVIREAASDGSHDGWLVNEHHFRLASGLAGKRPGTDHVERSRDCRNARDAGLLSEWNGYVPEAGRRYVRDHSGGVADEYSASALENYLTCPHAYLVEKVVGATRLDRPENADEVKAKDRGSLVHKIFELVTAEWTSGRIRDVDELRRCAYEFESASIASFEASFAVGDGFAWEVLKERIHHAVDEWCLDVSAMLGGSDVADGSPGPISGERAFGRAAGRPVSYTVRESGRALNLRGSIDRVDVYDTPDGRAARVVDYKTANPDTYKDFRDPARAGSFADLTAGGKLVQPGIYLAAVRADADIAALCPRSWTIGYHVFDARGDLRKAEMTVTADAEEAFDQLMNEIDAGFAAGFYAPIGIGGRSHAYCAACHVGVFDAAQAHADALAEAWLELRSDETTDFNRSGVES